MSPTVRRIAPILVAVVLGVLLAYMLMPFKVDGVECPAAMTLRAGSGLERELGPDYTDCRNAAATRFTRGLVALGGLALVAIPLSTRSRRRGAVAKRSGDANKLVI